VTVKIAAVELTRFPWAAGVLSGRGARARGLPDRAPPPVLRRYAVRGHRHAGGAPRRARRVPSSGGFAAKVPGRSRSGATCFDGVATGHLHFGPRGSRRRAPARARALGARASWPLDEADRARRSPGRASAPTSRSHRAHPRRCRSPRFLVGAAAARRSLGQVARVVTGFTVAHSLTLAVAVLGAVQPSARRSKR